MLNQSMLQDKAYKVTADDMDIKIESKLLSSGRCQIKFEFLMEDGRGIYGYTLIEPTATMKDLVKHLTSNFDELLNPSYFHQKHLFSIDKIDKKKGGNFWLYKM